MNEERIDEARRSFRRFLEEIPADKPLAVLCHSDVDGLAAGAILTRALRAAGRTVESRPTAKAENPWSASASEWLTGIAPAGIFVADLGSRARPILDSTPTLLIDHHRPLGVPPLGMLISGYDWDPVPTSGLLAYWCCKELTDVSKLEWIAAISILSDRAETYGFEELRSAQRQSSTSALREATTLLNAPRRSASGDASVAFALLLEAEHPFDITRRKTPQTQTLHEARAYVQQELARVRKTAPRVKGDVALIRIDTPCQLHPLIAQMWAPRLKKQIVICANLGYRPGYVHFSVRSNSEVNLLDYLRDRAPEGVTEHYGSGHDRATGGALDFDQWAEFEKGLGLAA